MFVSYNVERKTENFIEFNEKVMKENLWLFFQNSWLAFGLGEKAIDEVWGHFFLLCWEDFGWWNGYNM